MSITKTTGGLCGKRLPGGVFGGFMLIELLFSLVIIICSTLLMLRYNSALITLYEGAYRRIQAIDHTASLLDKISYYKKVPSMVKSQTGQFSSEIYTEPFYRRKSDLPGKGLQKLSVITRWKMGEKERTFKVVTGVFLDS